jgi:hypothetical protein
LAGLRGRIDQEDVELVQGDDVRSVQVARVVELQLATEDHVLLADIDFWVLYKWIGLEGRWLRGGRGEGIREGERRKK